MLLALTLVPRHPVLLYCFFIFIHCTVGNIVTISNRLTLDIG
jgi:hypothetical protein